MQLYAFKHLIIFYISGEGPGPGLMRIFKMKIQVSFKTWHPIDWQDSRKSEYIFLC